MLELAQMLQFSGAGSLGMHLGPVMTVRALTKFNNENVNFAIIIVSRSLEPRPKGARRQVLQDHWEACYDKERSKIYLLNTQPVPY